MCTTILQLKENIWSTHLQCKQSVPSKSNPIIIKMYRFIDFRTDVASLFAKISDLFLFPNWIFLIRIFNGSLNNWKNFNIYLKLNEGSYPKTKPNRKEQSCSENESLKNTNRKNSFFIQFIDVGRFNFSKRITNLTQKWFKRLRSFAKFPLLPKL